MTSDEMGQIFYYLAERDRQLGTISAIAELHVQREMVPPDSLRQAYEATARRRADNLRPILDLPET